MMMIRMDEDFYKGATGDIADLAKECASDCDENEAIAG
jgi:hypothetical protein